MPNVVCFVTRHQITERQRRDFIGWKLHRVAFRYTSVHMVWLDVVLECGCAPDVVVTVLPNAWQKYWVKHVHRMSPRTVVVLALTESDKFTPSGLYVCLHHVFGKGLLHQMWLPEQFKLSTE